MGDGWGQEHVKLHVSAVEAPPAAECSPLVTSSDGPFFSFCCGLIVMQTTARRPLAVHSCKAPVGASRLAHCKLRSFDSRFLDGSPRETTVKRARSAGWDLGSSIGRHVIWTHGIPKESSDRVSMRIKRDQIQPSTRELPTVGAACFLISCFLLTVSRSETMPCIHPCP